MLELFDFVEDPLRQILYRKFGHREFRLGQSAIINHVIQGNDALAVMPTGGGKSLCFQLPGFVREGICLVISPLIALMDDQVEKLKRLGMRAYSLNSMQEMKQNRIIEKAIHLGEVDYLYLSPERMMDEKTWKLVFSKKISLIAIDEAHCLSMWGHDFRPLYLSMAKKISEVQGVPKIALTASADRRTCREIVEILNMKNGKIFLGELDRKNIFYNLYKKEKGYCEFKKLLNTITGEGPGIIYCLSRRKTEEVADYLADKGIKILPYHAGLDPLKRRKAQNDFLTGKINYISATIAFGMGIDKPDVREVIHMDMPKNVENYYQETGRAGRDGKESVVTLFYARKDKVILSRMIRMSGSPLARQQIESFKLDMMEALCTLQACKRNGLLRYFGQKPQEPCGKCSYCVGNQNEDYESHSDLICKNLIKRIHSNDKAWGVERWIRDLKDHPLEGVIIPTGAISHKYFKFVFCQMLTCGIFATNQRGQIILTTESLDYLRNEKDFRLPIFPVSKKKKRLKRFARKNK